MHRKIFSQRCNQNNGTGAFAAGGGLSFFTSSVLLSTLGAGAPAGAAAAVAAAGGRTGGSDVAGFVSDFAVVGAIAFSAAYIFDVWYVNTYIFKCFRDK